MYQKFRIIVAGGRDFDNYELLERTLEDYIRNMLDLGSTDIIEIISGRAVGADRLGELFADRSNIPVTCFEANWRTYGKSAGPMRNREMAVYASEEGYYGILIAFWNGYSKGTSDMIKAAEKYDLEIKIVEY